MLSIYSVKVEIERIRNDKKNNTNILLKKKEIPNTCFNLINPLAWFVQNNNAQTTPSLRSSSGADLKVKLMLDRRLRRQEIL